MLSDSKVTAFEKRLRTLLRPALRGAEVRIETDKRFERPLVVVRWGGFNGLFAEQRFRRVVERIPEDEFKQHVRRFFWFELADGESIEDYMRMRRSDDVLDRASELRNVVLDSGFFDRLSEAMGADPGKACDNAFKHVWSVFRALDFEPGTAESCCLLFLANGAYCDCGVLSIAQLALTRTET